MLAVHLSDGVAGVPAELLGFAVAAVLVAWSLPAVTDEATPRVALLTAAFFVVTHIHFRTPAGTSVHLLCNGLMGVVLGRASVAALAVGLAMQALMLGHGGVRALGINVAVYALPTLIVVGLRGPVLRLARTRRLLAGALLGGGAALLTVALNAAVVRLAGPDPTGALAAAVAAMHLPLIGVEAAATAFVLDYLARARPTWLADYASGGKTSSNGTSH